MTARIPERAVGEDPVTVGARPAIEVSHLHKTYGETVAVDDVSFSVAEGQIFGLLGPNGAGKTTTVECAVGLRRADSGQVRILGLDPARDRERLRFAVGVQLQSSALPGQAEGRRAARPVPVLLPRARRPAELAERLGLADKRDDYYRSLSGGQKQRLSIALALIGQPEGRRARRDDDGPRPPRPARHLGPDRAGARRRGHDPARHPLHGGGRAALRRSSARRPRRVVAAGTPEQLAHHADAGQQVHFVPSKPFDDRLLTELPEVSGVEHHGRRVQVSGTGDLVSAVIQALGRPG